jgi:glycosyltransferase involved in cell wall biosynthesis
VRPEEAAARPHMNLRVAFILPGLHRVARGAEVALESIGRELADTPGFTVTLIGSGHERPGTRYRFIHSPNVSRERFERWPRFPAFRNEYAWEEATFAAGLRRRYQPASYDAVVTCSYPFINWLVRLRGGRPRPKSIFVTQNGDWPIRAGNAEFRWFSCDAVVCTNPVYFERCKEVRPSWLIPNAVDLTRFQDAVPNRSAWGVPSRRVILMVSALIPSKRVLEAIRTLAPMPDVHLLLAGDGPLREAVDSEARALLGSRFTRVTVPFDGMPSLYRSADVLLHMSEEEAFGNVYVEALAAGLPVVAHDWSSTRWLFGDQAILVNTRDEPAVRAGLERALLMDSSDEIAERVALVSRRFTWKAVGQQYAQCLRSVVAPAAADSTAPSLT